MPNASLNCSKWGYESSRLPRFQKKPIRYSSIQNHSILVPSEDSLLIFLRAEDIKTGGGSSSWCSSLIRPAGIVSWMTPGEGVLGGGGVVSPGCTPPKSGQADSTVEGVFNTVWGMTHRIYP